ncbi:MAG: preprotein translocase subunit SecY [Candidatus Sumerlaeaceae bacterium]
MIRSVGALRNVWKIPDLKRKILYTLMILFVYRIGAHIPTPFVDRAQLAEFVDRQRTGLGAGLFQVMDLFSGKAFEQMSVFALGIMPYISVSIILQLLTVVYPKLQKIQQEGALGQRKINRMTRQFTIALALLQSFGLAVTLKAQGLTYFVGSYSWIFLFTTMIAMTTGTAFVMWLGERITEQGIGNGISLIIAVGILAHYPSDLTQLITLMQSGALEWIWLIAIAVLFGISTMAIILIQDGTRRIPMQHAKRVVGRRVMSGGTNYLPLKVNTAGVIPVIFASAILAFPTFLASLFSGGDETGGVLGNLFRLESSYNLYNAANMENWGGGFFNLFKSVNLHILLFALLTGFFCYFYTAVAFNPDDVANNLKKSGSFIPGKRPGKPTSEYIDYVLTRVTTVGAFFLVAIAVTPLVLQVSFNMPYQAMSFVGGTGLIIVVGVLLDTLKQIESQLLMRHYEGFAMRRTSTAKWR